MIRSKEWFLKVDQSRRSSRLSNRSSPYKYPRRFSSDDPHQLESSSRTKTKSKTRKTSLPSTSSVETEDDEPSFFPPPPSAPAVVDTTNDDADERTMTEKIEPIAVIRHETPPTVPPHPPLAASRLSRERVREEEEEEPKRFASGQNLPKNTVQLPSLPSSGSKESIRKVNTFTSSSHSMVDAGCGGHFLSKLPALRCFRSHKHHHHHSTHKFHKTSPVPPPPFVVR